jgi:hypothetical protein
MDDQWEVNWSNSEGTQFEGKYDMDEKEYTVLWLIIA